MWGRKEDPTPAPGTTSPGRPEAALQPDAAPSPAPASRPTAPAAQPLPGSTGAHIGKSLSIKGQISGSEDLFIDGEVEGKITLDGNSLTVGPNGNVRAEVTARSITILGRLLGNVRASERIEIRKTGSLEGDLVTARIVIEEDAMFRGSIDIVKPGQEAAMKEQGARSAPPAPEASQQKAKAAGAKSGGPGAPPASSS